jgi:ABC-2 type transport system ATP-binding protein
VGLLGANGAGKSTLIRVLLGHLRPTAGRALIFGRPITAYPVPLRRVGAMADSVGLEPSLSARRLLRILCVGAAVDEGRIEEVLDCTGSAPYADRAIRTLSSGMRRRVALAVAIIGDPQLLVLDEPVNGLDPDGIRWFRQFIRDFTDGGGSVLLSSHLLSEVEQTVDRLVLLRHQLVFDGTLDQLPSAGLEESYFSLTDDARAPQRMGARP